MDYKTTLVIDYGVGNHQSVTNALDFLGYGFLVSSKIEDIRLASSYILPGVGAFGEAMHNLHRLGIVNLLTEEVLVKKKPILGICLGMQVLAEYSVENGYHEGLGWIEGRVDKFEAGGKIRIPHVGWNTLQIVKKDLLFARTKEDASFYFDHSYHFVCQDNYVLAKCRYGIDFVAAVQKDNILGVQFHPEKSQTSGLKLFRSFFNYLRKKDKGTYQYA